MAKRGSKPKRKETRGRPRKHAVPDKRKGRSGRKVLPFLDDPDRFAICIAWLYVWHVKSSPNKALTIAVLATQGGESVIQDHPDGTKNIRFGETSFSPVYGAMLPASDRPQSSLEGRIRYLKAKMRGTKSHRRKAIKIVMSGDTEVLNVPPGSRTIQEANWIGASLEGLSFYLFPAKPGIRERGLAILHQLGWNLKNNPFNVLMPLDKTQEINLEFLTR